MANIKLGGRITLRINGAVVSAMGDWTYNLGGIRREFRIGADRPHGYVEKIELATLSGQITDRADLDVAALFELADTTIELALGNGKSIVFRNAAVTGGGDQSTENATIEIEFSAIAAEEILAAPTG